ncbi:MAG TPA: YceI family protein [Gemmatimonadaceae bacterium]|nr:YceI family protein [Gemmatimonadaceae bacterium]
MKWNLDTTHSTAAFAVKHLMISTVRGRFKKLTGSGETDENGVLKSVEMVIDAPSIDTNEPKRDDHLRSADFLDVANHPTITFRSTTIRQNGRDITITGNLTIRGVTRPVTLMGEVTAPVADPWGTTRAGLEVSTKISRKEWGLLWNTLLETGGFAVGDEVKIFVEVEAVAVSEQALAAA